MKSKPLVSVITAVRNCDKYISQTIESVLAQTYPNIEYIIIDGASTDRTVDIIRSYSKKIVYWVSEKDDGRFDAMNKGSDIAKGDYALYLNAGDYLLNKDTISEIVQKAELDKKCPPIIVGRVVCAIGDELLDWITPSDESWLRKYFPPHQAAFIGRDIYKAIPYRSMFKMAGDYDLWNRLKHTGKLDICGVDTIVSVYRLGGDSSNPGMEWMKYIEYEISNYLNTRKFMVVSLFRGYIIVWLKKFLMTVLGENRYYRYLLYGGFKLRLRKHEKEMRRVPSTGIVS